MWDFSSIAEYGEDVSTFGCPTPLLCEISQHMTAALITRTSVRVQLQEILLEVTAEMVELSN